MSIANYILTFAMTILLSVILLFFLLNSFLSYGTWDRALESGGAYSVAAKNTQFGVESLASASSLPTEIFAGISTVDTASAGTRAWINLGLNYIHDKTASFDTKSVGTDFKNNIISRIYEYAKAKNISISTPAEKANVDKFGEDCRDIYVKYSEPMIGMKQLTDPLRHLVTIFNSAIFLIIAIILLVFVLMFLACNRDTIKALVFLAYSLSAVGLISISVAGILQYLSMVPSAFNNPTMLALTLGLRITLFTGGIILIVISQLYLLRHFIIKFNHEVNDERSIIRIHNAGDYRIKDKDKD